MEKIPTCPFKQGAACRIRSAALPFLPDPLPLLTRLSECRIEDLSVYYQTAEHPDVEKFGNIFCPMALAILQLYKHIPEDIRPV